MEVIQETPFKVINHFSTSRNDIFHKNCNIIIICANELIYEVCFPKIREMLISNQNFYKTEFLLSVLVSRNDHQQDNLTRG
jgi:hypothetical protein